MNKYIDAESLLIIPCCKGKHSGGSDLPIAYTDHLRETVSPDQYNAILAAREPLNGLLKKSNEYMPAIDRYAGNLYKAFQNISTCIRTKTNSDSKPKLIILSALYGPLHPESLINDYDLAMPHGNNNIWNNNFPTFLADYVTKQKIKSIRFYCGRSTGYYNVVSNSVRSLLAKKLLREVIHYDVVNGSSYHTPYNHGLQLATDLCCGSISAFTRTVEAVKL